jgi:hypothetical protein
LPRKYAVEAQIIAGSRQRRRISCEGKRCERSSVCAVPDGEFGCQVLCVSGAAAIAEENELVAAAKRISAYTAYLDKGLPQRGAAGFSNGKVFSEFSIEEFVHAWDLVTQVGVCATTHGFS